MKVWYVNKLLTILNNTKKFFWCNYNTFRLNFLNAFFRNVIMRISFMVVKPAVVDF